MKNTGIMRRVDELGRIVLPRELRKLHRLDPGVKMNIYVNDEGDIILKKVSEMPDSIVHIERCISALASIIENDILITDREQVIAANRKRYLHKVLTEDAYKIVKSHDTVIKKRKDGAIIVDVLKDVKEKYDCQLFVPIVKEGDSMGCIIVLAPEGECFNNDGIKICKAFASLIGMIEE